MESPHEREREDGERGRMERPPKEMKKNKKKGINEYSIFDSVNLIGLNSLFIFNVQYVHCALYVLCMNMMILYSKIYLCICAYPYPI